MARTVIVGDIHGCAPELDSLLDRLAFSDGDRLVAVGDLVARGPDTSAVLATLRRVGGRSVVGNHDQRLLDARAARAQGERGPRLSPAHERVMARLSEQDWEDLAALPLSLELPEHDAAVVHAGLVPGIPLQQQDPWVLLHVRTLRPDGTPSDRRDAQLWGEVYAGPTHVAFGHNAIDGLQLHPYATGLDTGCVYGGKLSALVLDAGEPVPPAAKRHIVSVDARKEYVPLK